MKISFASDRNKINKQTQRDKHNQKLYIKHVINN